MDITTKIKNWELNCLKSNIVRNEGHIAKIKKSIKRDKLKIKELEQELN